MINIAKHQTLSLNYKELVYSTIKEKYNFFIIGFGVFILLLVGLAIWLMRSYKPVMVKKQAQTETQVSQPNTQVKTYTVREGDYLWKIAEEVYGSGFNAIDIAKVNNIANANIITTGQKLILPLVQARAPTRGEIVAQTTAKVTFTGDKYTVKSGDHLWKIALESYGDGYGWTKLAKANNIANPDLIEPGKVIKIPR